tara:strand:- start:214 stop:381 length:168 start_codon:yes stop_codon:yes gene_type:complete
MGQPENNQASLWLSVAENTIPLSLSIVFKWKILNIADLLSHHHHQKEYNIKFKTF